MARKLKIYDVYFTLECPACMVVEAHSKKEAGDVAEDDLCCLSQTELVERLLAAADGGLKVVKIDYVDEAE